MASGNFLVGKGLSITGFLTYINYELSLLGIEVTNRVLLSNSHSFEGSILVSLKGKGDLEKILLESIKKGKKRLSSNIEKSGYNSGKIVALSPQLDFYKNLGIYEDDNAASRDFPLLSQRYLSEAAVKAIGDAKKKLDNMFENK